VTKGTILVVEDESIVAMDLQQRLIGMGYSVPATAATGHDALKKVADFHPDLVLMDIRLRGDMDGIEAAEQIRDLLDVPPLYLTAYTDEETLRRAKITEPFGYLVKPFDERTLRSTVEMALYRSQRERQLKRCQARLDATLRCVSEAVIVADENLRVVSTNSQADALTGRKRGEASGLQLSALLRFQDGREVLADELIEAARQDRGQPATKPAMVRLSGTLTTPAGGSVPVEGRVAPIIDRQGAPNGAIVAIRATAEAGPGFSVAN